MKKNKEGVGPKKKIKVLAIDPGTTNCGWSILEYVTTTGEITIAKLGTIHPRRIVSRVAMDDRREKFGGGILRIDLLRNEISDIIEENNPEFIAIEDAFYNPKFPNAYGIILQCITTIQLLIFRSFNKKIYKIPTKSHKETVTGNGSIKKDCVQNIVINHPELTYRSEKLKLKMTQDEADAISVGFHFCKKMILDLLI